MWRSSKHKWSGFFVFFCNQQKNIFKLGSLYQFLEFKRQLFKKVINRGIQVVDMLLVLSPSLKKKNDDDETDHNDDYDDDDDDDDDDFYQRIIKYIVVSIL